MSRLIEDKIIEEKYANSNLTYVINDNSIFSEMEYKIMKNQTHESLVKCMKTMYNGKVQIYYVTNTFVFLNSIIKDLPVDKIYTLISNLLKSIIDVESTGFLHLESIDLDFNHIYVDQNTLQVALIYVPLKNTRFFSSKVEFENHLRFYLSSFIYENLGGKTNDNIDNFMNKLKDTKLSIKEIYLRTVSYGTGSLGEKENNDLKVTHFVYYNPITNVKKDILISKYPFIIGRSPQKSDAALTFDKTISNAHVQVERINGKYYIRDLNSANGTFVNGARIQKGGVATINSGDEIILAKLSMKFYVK